MMLLIIPITILKIMFLIVSALLNTKLRIALYAALLELAKSITPHPLLIFTHICIMLHYT